MTFATKSIINFDNNATTTISKEALEKMNEVYGCCGNSSSVHFLGRHSAMLIEESRQELSDVLNAQNYEIYFTSGGTEANNTALFSDDYDVILFSKIEHSSIYNTRPKHSEIVELKVDKNCQIDLDELSLQLESCKGKNFLVSIMLANSETGAIQPLKEIAKLVHQYGGLIHSDLVQAFGKIKIDLEDLNVDFASVSAHKISGPQGVGALLVRRGIDIRPLIYGGGHERGKRAGTMNTAGIAAFGVACKNIDKKISGMEKLQEIRDFIETETKKIAGDNIIFFAKDAPRTANTSYMAVKNTNSQTLLIHFDLNNIMVSAGSACSSGSTKPSRILEAIDAPKEFLSGAMRISLSLENTMDEAKKFIEIFKEFYNKNYGN